MKKIFTFFVLLTLMYSLRAQYTQTPPNNTFQTANYLPFGSSMTGFTCSDTGIGYYVMVVPASGTLRIATSAATVDSTPGKPFDLAIVVYSKEIATRGLFSVKTGDSIPVTDTIQWTCLAPDTIYVGINCPDFTRYCFKYTFSCSISSPAFSSNVSQNNSSSTAAALAEGTTVNGQLGFKTEPSAPSQPAYFMGVLPQDGQVQIYTGVDFSNAVSPGLNVTVYDKNLNVVDSLEARMGPLGAPLMDTLVADCMPADTFYLRLSQNSGNDCGWSYSLSYGLVPPTYGNDEEPNNNFAEAQSIDAGRVVVGNAYYGQDHSDDYFKLYKPDNGFLQVAINSESDIAVGAMTVYIYDYNANFIDSTNVTIGTPSSPGPGLLYEQSLAEDTFYIRVKWPTNGHCGSYNFETTTSTVSTVKNVAQLLPVSVMPNPSSGDFTFNLDGFQVSAIQLYAIDGRVVENITGAQLQNRLVTVGGELESGVYIARLFNGSEVTGIAKLVKTSK